MARRIEVINAEPTSYMAEPVNGTGTMRFSTGVVVGALVTAWLMSGGSCDDKPAQGPGDNKPVVQTTAPVAKQ